MHTLHLFLRLVQEHQEWDLDNPDDIHDLYQDVTLDVQDLADGVPQGPIDLHY